MISWTQRATAVAPGELDQLERQARDQRDADDPGGEQDVPVRQPDRGEDEDRDDHHDEQEARAAARVQAREALRVLDGQLQAGLVGRDDLVLGAVVLEQPAQIALLGEDRDVAEEDDGPDDALDEPEQERRSRASSLIRLVRSTGTAKNRPTASASAATIVSAQVPLPIGSSSSAACALALTSSALKPIESDWARAIDAADHGPAQHAAAGHPRDDGVRFDGDLAVLAGRHRPGGDAAHHHALEDGLAAHGGIALLRAAHISVIGSPERAEAFSSTRYLPPRLRASLRWKRSTRPPVSTSFCLPV